MKDIMNESKLRETIRKEIRTSLKEVDVTTGVERETSKIEKNAGVKMLKRALAQGSPRQQAAGHKVITLLCISSSCLGSSPSCTSISLKPGLGFNSCGGREPRIALDLGAVCLRGGRPLYPQGT